MHGGGDTNPRITHFKTQGNLFTAAFAYCEFGEYFALFGKLNRIADEVHQHLSQATGVAFNTGGNIVWNETFHLKVFLLRHCCHDAADAFHQFTRGKLNQFQFNAACFQFREVEDVIDNIKHDFARGIRGIDEQFLPFVQLRAFNDF